MDVLPAYFDREVTEENKLLHPAVVEEETGGKEGEKKIAWSAKSQTTGVKSSLDGTFVGHALFNYRRPARVSLGRRM